MDADSLDDHFKEEIYKITGTCSTIITALKEKMIDQRVAFEVLYNLRESAINAFNMRCKLYDLNKLDYSSIEEAKRDFWNWIDDEAYKIASQDHVVEEETQKRN